MQSNDTSSGAHKPPPRRKACEECFKSKRRCDLGLPSCCRCSKLGLVCHYQVPPQRVSGRPTATGSVGIDTSSNSIPLLDVEMLANELPYTDDLAMSFMNETMDPDTQTSPMLLHSYAKVPTLADAVSADLFNPPGSRLDYIVKMLKSGPSRMVHENSTPWSHALLYKVHMPQSMHHAYAACAMYIAKNEVNKQMIFRAIDKGATDLLKSPQSTVPIEILARVQSLLLYQIIRLYDGDIRLRVRGEADMADLEICSYFLLSLLDDHGFSADDSIATSEARSTYFSSSSPPSHATWVFQESCRRTYLLSLFFVSLYTMLKEASCMHAFDATRIWTFSAQLWNAPSEFDFKVAWREKRHFIVRNLDFSTVLLEASPEDVDDYGKAFLVMTQGPDDVREWYYKRGSAFA